jgi:hypothetical protein
MVNAANSGNVPTTKCLDYKNYEFLGTLMTLLKKSSLRRAVAEANRYDLMLALSAIVIALVITELIARILGPPYGLGNELNRQHECDPVVGWRGVPNSQTTLNQFGYEHEFALNSQGMHDQEHPLKKDDNTFRIMILGDSMIEAVDVDETETSHQILEDRLNSQAPAGIKFEVISAAIISWGPAQELVYFRSQGQAYQPDLVLAVWFPGNDLRDVLPDHVMTVGPQGGVHCYAPYFAICQGEFDPQPWYSAPGIYRKWQSCTTQRRVITNILSFIYNNSLLYQRLGAVMAKVYDKDEFSPPTTAPWLDKNRTDPVLNGSYQVTEGIYSQLAVEAGQIGAKTAFVIAPLSQSLDFETNPDIQAQMIALEPTLANADPILPNRTFVELITAHNLPVLDLHPYFRDHIKSGGEAVHLKEDNHWTIAGNRLAGERVAEWLIEQELVPVHHQQGVQ